MKFKAIPLLIIQAFLSGFFFALLMVSWLDHESINIKVVAVFVLLLVTMSCGLVITKTRHALLIEKVQEAKKTLSDFDHNVELAVQKRTKDMEIRNGMLANKANTDMLTKALNKAAIMEIMDNMIISGNEFCVIMFDVDNFKSINDGLGHITGDKCLRTLSLTARSILRQDDYLGRYGGDEFIILLNSVTVTEARFIGERLRKNIEDTDSPHFTISMGVANFPHDAANTKDLISFADEGLYKSKGKGKNALSHKTLF